MSYGTPCRFVTKHHPNRYVLDDFLRTQGPTPGRDTSCMICLEEMTAEDTTITHGLPGQGECNNAFHSACFDGLVASVKLADDLDPAGANSNEFGRQFAKCPMCRGTLYPYEKQGCQFPPALEVEREGVSFEAAERAAAETAFGDHDEDSEIEFEINDERAHLAETRRYQRTFRPSVLGDGMTFMGIRFWSHVLLRDDWQNLILEFHMTTSDSYSMVHLNELIDRVARVRAYGIRRAVRAARAVGPAAREQADLP